MNVCLWIQVDNEEMNIWATQCGEEFVFEEGTPKDNHFNFCVFCGKPLQAKGNVKGDCFAVARNDRQEVTA